MAFDKNNPKNRKRRKVCQFCVDKATYIDYKDTAKLRRYLSERGKILPRRTTGTCAMHQRELTEAIKRSRQMKPEGALFSSGRETELRKAPHRALRALSLFNLPQKRRSFCRGTGSSFENARPLQFAIDLLNKSSILGTSSRKGERER